jgi:hypothetical protein
MSVEYKLDGDAVLRKADGVAEEVAIYDAEAKVLTIPYDKQKLKNRIVRELNLLDVTVDRVDILGQPVTEPAPVAKVIPDKPKPFRAMGDKTPALVQWYHDNDFPEFKRRYGVKSDKPGDDGRYVGNRNTNLTRRIQTGDAANEYAD